MGTIKEQPTVRIEWDDGSTASVSVSDIARIGAIIGLPLPDDPEWERQQAAKGKVAAIPSWASWTEDEALAWHDTNIADPLTTVPDIDGLTAQQFQANVQAIMALYQDVLAMIETENRALVRMALALRNETWPGLEGI